MKVEDIAKILNDCANNKCQKCEFKTVPAMYCQQHMVKKMAEECRKIAERET